MCMCTFVCLCSCLHICVPRVYTCAPVCERGHVCVCVHTCVVSSCVCLCMHMCVCEYAHVCATVCECGCVSLCAHMCVHIHVCLRSCVCTPVCLVYTRVHLYVCAHMCACVLAWRHVCGWQGGLPSGCAWAEDVRELEARRSRGTATDLTGMAFPSILPAGKAQKCHLSLLENGNQVGRNSLGRGMLWEAMNYRLRNGHNGIWNSLGKNGEK